MEFRILGPLEVRTDDGLLALGGAKPRALLVALLLHPNEPISAERLAVSLWGEEAPAGAVKMVQVHVSRLRKALGDSDRVVTTPAGYRLRVDAGELDADRFEQLSQDGRRALADGQPERAASVLRDALSLWRGPALADFALEAFAQAEIERLEEERLAVLEARIDADLAAGRHAELVGELQQLVIVNPLRERLHGQLMLVLYRCGRQADALRAYRQARDSLVEQLGIEPGPDLRALERAILGQDSALELGAQAPRVMRRAAAARISAPPTPTIGREDELAGLSALLRQRVGRLVTLVGPGGVGKTRLALELARSAGDMFGDGVYFVSLAPVSSHQQVASTIARDLDVELLPSESPEEALARHLSDREALLVLDNFEHVLDAAALVADLVAAASNVTLLVTSREPLRLRAERLFDVEPLALPSEADGDGADLERSSAAALFVALASARDRRFDMTAENAAAVARVCRRLDGLPLALELAAGRIGLLSVVDVAARLHDDLGALGPASRDAPSRQRTLTATLEWSYALLTREEQAAFTALSVFAGGCTLGAAQTVTGAPLEVLEALVAKNVVVRVIVPNGGVRLTLLETIGAFARDRFGHRADAGDLARRHCDYYLALAERAKSELERSEPPALLAKFDREIHNLEAALRWALDQNAAVPALRLAAAVVEYWWSRSMLREPTRWLGDALALPDDDVPASLRAEVLAAYAFCLVHLGKIEAAEAAAREGLDLARGVGDAAQSSAALNSLAAAAMADHRDAEGYRLATEAVRLARDAGDEPKRGAALFTMAQTAPTLAEALALAEAASRWAGSPRRVAILRAGLPYTALLHGDLTAAQRLADEGLRAAAASGDIRSESLAHNNAGLVALLTGDAARAAQAFLQALLVAKRDHYEEGGAPALGGLAAVAAAQGRDEVAAELSGAADIPSLSARLHPDVVCRLDERYFTPAQKRLGEQRWHEASAAGATLTFAQATDSALAAYQVVSSDRI